MTQFQQPPQGDQPSELRAAGEPFELKPRIIVFGVGGAGGNAINNMIAKDLDGVEFIAANTDAQALRLNNAPVRVQMGAQTTGGLGAGANPAVGGQAAEESVDEIKAALQGANMCFVTAGLGGGTGTGAAPVIARTARELGVLTVGVVTKPFSFEGARRMRLAEVGLAELTGVVDTLIVIPNQNLFRVANERTSFADAFIMADDVLYQGVKGVTDLMVRPGLVNLDFADVRAVMDEMGKAMMGSGEADGDNRAIEAAERAIDNPLLDEVSLKGARGVLINITGGPDMKLFEVDEAANLIRKEADPDADVFFGSALDPTMEGRIRVSVVATGIQSGGGGGRLEAPRDDALAGRSALTDHALVDADAGAAASSASGAPEPSLAPPSPEPVVAPAAAAAEPPLRRDQPFRAAHGPFSAPGEPNEPTLAGAPDAAAAADDPSPQAATEAVLRPQPASEEAEAARRYAMELAGANFDTNAPSSPPRPSVAQAHVAGPNIDAVIVEPSAPATLRPEPFVEPTRPATPDASIVDAAHADPNAAPQRVELPKFLRRRAV